MAVTAQEDEVRRVISVALDAAFYRAVNAEAPEAVRAPLSHYAAKGWRAGLDPAPWFSVSRYLAANPDVARAGVEPLHHYLTQGRREGRQIAPSSRAGAYLLDPQRETADLAWSFAAQAAGSAPMTPLADWRSGDITADRAVIADWFDRAFYLTTNPDVAASGVDPLEHFLQGGWRQNRDPSPTFSVADYRQLYPDIVEAGTNPFVHFVSVGRSEGRSARQDLGFRYQVIAALAPAAARLAAAVHAAAKVAAGSAAELAAGLAANRTGLADLHVTVSHDDYSANMGGIQQCVRREAACIAELGRDHLHLYPATAWPVVRAVDEPAYLGVLLNGRRLGVFSPEVVMNALGQAAAGPAGQRSFAIHSLLGHNADETADILGVLGLKAGYFWLHDFASLCAGVHLQRNDVEDCGAPAPDSAACAVCIYGPLRARHMTEHARLFRRLELTAVAPSQTTLDLWRARGRHPAEACVVLPHARLEPRGAAPTAASSGALRVAYAGMPWPHKGWPIFRELARVFGADPRYEFHHLGGRTEPAFGVTFHEVVVTEAQPQAMQAALEALEIDVVLVWPLCRETFSFTAYEAVAAGSAVITGPDSGNVAAFVAESGEGRVLPTESELSALFADGGVLGLARARRKPQLHDIAFSGLTVDLLRQGAPA
jgi:hypothetical protein